MPSPFPGMDPYLENRRLWPVFHKGFLSALMFDLNEFLPPDFLASQDERVYLASADREIQPDTAILRVDRRDDDNSPVSLVTLTEDPPVVVEVGPLEEVREPYIEILTTKEPQRVVTVIEVLSPKNKYESGNGRESYRRKQRDFLRSGIHLIEIDFLRGGNHTVALNRDLLDAYEPFDYLISLHRANREGHFEAWPLAMSQRLPRIRVPLIPDMPDLIFDLQIPFDRTYDGGRFASRIDYRQEPTPRLATRYLEEWVDELLHDKGKRGTDEG